MGNGGIDTGAIYGIAGTGIMAVTTVAVSKNVTDTITKTMSPKRSQSRSKPKKKSKTKSKGRRTKQASFFNWH